MWMRASFIALSALLSLYVSACNLLIPDVPEPLSHEIARDSLVFTQLSEFCEQKDINELYTCAELSSLFTASGYCVPKPSARGSMLHCKLEAPLAEFNLACGRDAESPELYYRFVWRHDARDIDFSASLGECVIQLSGPLAGYDERYATDRGYGVCLFSQSGDGVVSLLLAEEGRNIVHPSGLYIDFSDVYAENAEYYKQGAVVSRFDAQIVLEADSRRLESTQRQALLRVLPKLFAAFYAPTQKGDGSKSP
jgi:hypothetical protein